MKLILFYAYNFKYKTAEKGLDSVPDIEKEESVEQAVVVFFHVEAEDMEKRAKVIQKFVKNIKWLCGKFSSKNVVLHSFNHLSLSKADPDFSKGVLDQVMERLCRTGYQVFHTPFGYFHEFQLHVAGDSLAKVYKEF